MTKAQVLAICFTFLFGAACAAGAPASMYKYDIVHQITPDDIWHSGQKSVQGGAASILYLDFDRETADQKGEWLEQGLVLGGGIDLDSSPIAIRLWSKKPAHLNQEASALLSAKNGGAVAAFDLDGSDCPPAGLCPSTRFLLAVMRDGKVYANATLVGTAE